MASHPITDLTRCSREEIELFLRRPTRAERFVTLENGEKHQITDLTRCSREEIELFLRRPTPPPQGMPPPPLERSLIKSANKK
jgi:hypothetical protein